MNQSNEIETPEGGPEQPRESRRKIVCGEPGMVVGEPGIKWGDPGFNWGEDSEQKVSK